MGKEETIKKLRKTIKEIERIPAGKKKTHALINLAIDQRRLSLNPPIDTYIPDDQTRHKMNWKNLRNGLCPKCNSLLIDHPGNKSLVKCTVCDFLISNSKINNILKNN